MMATKNTETKETPKTLTILVTEQKLNVPVIDLDTVEEKKVEVIRKLFVIPSGMDEKTAHNEASKLVQPQTEQTKALLNYASSKSYQDSKGAALSKGNFLTSALRSKIVAIMSQHEAYSELSAKDCFERWLTGFKAKKPAAQKFLDMAKASEQDELADL